MTDIDRLVEELARDTAPVRPAPHPFRVSLQWLAGAAAYVAVSLLVSGPRPDLAAKLHQPWFVAELLSLLLLVITSALSAALLAFPDLHQKRPAAFAPIGSFVLFVAVLFFAWRADTPPAPLPLHSIECTLSIALLAVLPAAAAFIAMRRFASTHPRFAGSTALLFAFGVSALWLRLHEVNDSVLHVIDWHYLPMLAAGMAGLAVGRRFLRW